MNTEKRIIITTTLDVPGKKIESILGLVFATAAIESKESLTEAAFDKLREKAIELEADAVVGLTQSTSLYEARDNNGVTTFLGTAVKLSLE